MNEQIEAETGVRPPFALGAFSDLDANVKDTIARLEASPFIPAETTIRGFVYEVKRIAPRGHAVGVARTSLHSGFSLVQSRTIIPRVALRDPDEMADDRAGIVSDEGGDAPCWAHLLDGDEVPTDEALATSVRTLADAVVVADPSGTIVSWNSAAERLFGWTAAEAVGETKYGDPLLEVPALHRDGRPLSICRSEGRFGPSSTRAASGRRVVTPRRMGPPTGSDRPTHPRLAAALLVLGVFVLIVVLAVAPLL